MAQKRLTIITPYHFNSENTDAYSRLLKSLRASANEIGKDGRIILVANGVSEGTESTSKVIRDLNLSREIEIVPVELEKNGKNTGGINAGIKMALNFPIQTEEEFIGSVQSSCVLQSGWFAAAKKYFEVNNILGIFGRLYFEDDPEYIWADGHYLSKGKTWNGNYMRTPSNEDKTVHFGFPCLSAAIFKKSLVENIVHKYGDFVCNNLSQYGDCTDIAARSMEIFPKGKFAFVKNATAIKRRPLINPKNAFSSQLIASEMYYSKKHDFAKSRVRKATEESKLEKKSFVDVLNNAESLLKVQYSPRREKRPSISKILDPDWGSD